MRASEKTRRLTGLALLTAIIVVLQIVASFIKFGPFSITLALAPIIIGAALYGPKAGAIAAGIVSPVVNTGLFCLCLTLLFHDILVSWAGGTDIMYYIIFGLTGINFVLELVINLVLSTVIVRVVSARKHA